MRKINSLKIFYDGRSVGTMALYKNRLTAFEYSREWLVDGLFGIFADSLPDGWGRLLVDRLMLKKSGL